jgi:hypothetical protein
MVSIRAPVSLSAAGGAARVGKALADEVDWSSVVATMAAEQARELVVELIDVDAAEPDVAGDAPLELERHLRHIPEHASALKSSQPERRWDQASRRSQGELFGTEFALDRLGDVVAQRGGDPRPGSPPGLGRARARPV